MITIGILGANGQVGAEVCLFLSKMENISVIPICRTEHGSAFLRKRGLECRHGSLNGKEESTQLLKDCDLVADFTYLKGLPSEIRSTSKKIISNAIKYSPPHACFVFASSMMAFGMGKQSRLFKPYIFARTVYGASKRYSEKLTFHLGKETKKKVYVLRLGQVHGELQSISRKILDEVTTETTFIPNSPSYTVFAFSIAEALVNIAKGKEKPGMYTLISNPEWTWKEIHEFYCNEVGIKPELILINNYTNKSGNIFTSMKQFILNQVFSFANNYVEVLASYFLANFPTLEKRAMSIYYRRKARAQILEIKNQNIFNSYTDFIVDKIPGERLQSISDSRTSMKTLSLEVKKTIKGVV